MLILQFAECFYDEIMVTKLQCAYQWYFGSSNICSSSCNSISKVTL